MTRAAFDAYAREIWAKAQANYEKDGTLHGVLIGFTGSGERVMCLGVSEDADEEEMESALRNGTFPIPGHFRDHAAKIHALFRSRKVLALILLGEAWFASGQVAQEVQDMGILPSQHPDRDEVIQLTALWPREFYARNVTRVITTHADGSRTLEPEDRLRFASFDNPASKDNIPHTWLLDLVPGPPGARAKTG